MSMAANLVPMPRAYLKISEKYRPSHPPIFDDEPSAADLLEARALFRELDAESQRWYCRSSTLFDGIA